MVDKQYIWTVQVYYGFEALPSEVFLFLSEGEARDKYFEHTPGEDDVSLTEMTRHSPGGDMSDGEVIRYNNSMGHRVVMG